MKQQGSLHIIVMIAVVLIGVICFAGWRVYNTQKTNDVTTSTTQQPPVDNSVNSAKDVADLESQVDATNIDNDLDGSSLDNDLSNLQ